MEETNNQPQQSDRSNPKSKYGIIVAEDLPETRVRMTLRTLVAVLMSIIATVSALAAIYYRFDRDISSMQVEVESLKRILDEKERAVIVSYRIMLESDSCSCDELKKHNNFIQQVKKDKNCNDW